MPKRSLGSARLAAIKKREAEQAAAKAAQIKEHGIAAPPGHLKRAAKIIKQDPKKLRRDALKHAEPEIRSMERAEDSARPSPPARGADPGRAGNYVREIRGGSPGLGKKR